MLGSKKMGLAVTAVALMGAGANAASAAIVVTSDNQLGTGGTTTFTPTYTIAQPDLLAGLLPTASTGLFSQHDSSGETSGDLPVLTDGTYGSINSGTTGAHTSFVVAGGGRPSAAAFSTQSYGTSVTWTLPAPASLSQIAVYGGWNDSGRDQQLYTVSITTTANATFTNLSLAAATATGGATLSGNTVSYNPTGVGSVQDANRTIISDTTGALLAANVTAIRIDFPTTVENGYTGYAEIAAVGTLVPEPASLGLLGLAAATGLACRRRGR